ncbi:MAG: aconitase X swivel domain-containing protein [Armatimonadota bacterium]
MEVRARTVSSGTAKGRAVVSGQPLNLLVALKAAVAWRHRLGKIGDRDHELYGIRTTGRILVVPELHGSTMGAPVLFELIRKRLAPRALILRQAGTLAAAVGALSQAWAERPFPIVDQPADDLWARLSTGDLVIVSAQPEGALITIP